MKSGFYTWFLDNNTSGRSPVDVFIITNRSRKTEAFAERILECLDLPATRLRFEQCYSRLEPAKLEIKTCSHGDYYDIHGQRFHTEAFVDGRDGKAIILKEDLGCPKLKICTE